MSLKGKYSTFQCVCFSTGEADSTLQVLDKDTGAVLKDITLKPDAQSVVLDIPVANVETLVLKTLYGGGMTNYNRSVVVTDMYLK